MDVEHRRMAAELRQMSSEEAAEWLMSRFPRAGENWGNAILLLAHLSLAKTDNLRLARHYLTGLPFASGRAYEVFAKRLSVPDLLGVIREELPTDASGLDLLLYYLNPVLRSAVKSPAGEDAIRAFLADVDARKCPGSSASAAHH